MDDAGALCRCFRKFRAQSWARGQSLGNGIKFRNAFGPERAKLAVSRQHGIKLAPPLPLQRKAQAAASCHLCVPQARR